MPKIGLRTLKTGFSVFLCVALFHLLNRPYPFYAAIAAVICMKVSISTSFTMGKSRMMGTLIGGTTGLIFSLFTHDNSFFCGIGIILVIYLCNFFHQKSSAAIACIVFTAIMTILKGVPSTVYAINRIIDTFIGIIISIIINKFVNFKCKSTDLEDPKEPI